MKDEIKALVPITRRAKKAIERRAYVELDEFPFRVGRESRISCRWGRYKGLQRRIGNALPNNDLYLLTEGRRSLFVSREHFQIEKTEDGTFELVDRGSTLGTTVEGKRIGGRNRERAVLRDGTRIAVGLPDSPFVFEFRSDIAPLRAANRRRKLTDRCVRTLLFGIAPVIVSILAIMSVL